MPEEQLYGKSGVEHAQGYTPLAEPHAQPADETVVPETKGLDQTREEYEAPPIIRDYRRADGEHVPETETLEIDRAARDLAAAREREAIEAKEQADKVAIEQVDQLRAERDPPAEVPPVPEPQPVEQAQPGIDPEIAEALAKPKVRAALEQHVQQVETARQTYNQVATEAAQLGMIAFFSDFPELQGLNPQQLPIAIEMLAKTNPARHAQLAASFQKFNVPYQNMQRAIQHEGQRAQASFQKFAADQDTEYEKFEKSQPPAVVRAVKENLMRVVRDTYGVNPDLLMKEYNNNPAFRSSQAQRMIFDAVTYRLALEGVQNHRGRAAPHVQRPGSAGERPSAAEQSFSSVERNFKSNPTAESGAAYLRARRAARG